MNRRQLFTGAASAALVPLLPVEAVAALPDGQWIDGQLWANTNLGPIFATSYEAGQHMRMDWFSGETVIYRGDE